MVPTALRLTPCLTPHHHLLLVPDADAPAIDPALGARLCAAFARGTGHGLLWLGAREVAQSLPPVFAYWREIGGRFVTGVCSTPNLDERDVKLPQAPDDLEQVAATAPTMPGAEYISGDALQILWTELGRAFADEFAAANITLQEFLKRLNPNWNVVGRVHFNLAENRKDETAPFAFMATYSHRLSAHGKVQHLPLGQALRDYAGAKNKDKLLSLLLPVQRAAEHCAWLKALVDSGEVFHPLRFMPDEAFRFLGDVPALEQAGVIVRMPAAFPTGRPPRPQVSARIGSKSPSGLVKDALLDFQLELTLDGERLTSAEIEAILAGSHGLQLIRGKWVEVDGARLEKALQHYREIEQLAAADGLSFAEAMRLLAGAHVKQDEVGSSHDPDWSRVVAGPWLAETLKGLREPEELAKVDPGQELLATLRPYQQVGVRWLHLLTSLGLGACLADDMLKAGGSGCRRAEGALGFYLRRLPRDTKQATKKRASKANVKTTTDSRNAKLKGTRGPESKSGSKSQPKASVKKTSSTKTGVAKITSRTLTVPDTKPKNASATRRATSTSKE